MTHTLHRRGTPESLSKDFVIMMIPAQGYNDAGSDDKLKQFLKIALRHDPKNVGTLKANMHSHSGQYVLDNAQKLAHAVFVDKETVVQVLKEVKEANLGLSVIVSGVLDLVNEAAKEAGINRHTVEFSLGIWGNTSRLPSDDVLQVTTMCGHGLISTSLVESLLEAIRSGSKTPDEASRELARHCCCGIFNPSRAADLLPAISGAAK